MGRPYPVQTVANAILDIAWRDGEAVSPMKLQKLVYLAHGLSLAMHEKPLIASKVEAWKYGPVIAPLYYETRQYGSGPITKPIILESAVLFSEDEDDVRLDEETRGLLKDVWVAYGGYSAVSLSELTHQHNLPEGYPWHTVWHEQGGKTFWGTDIPDNITRESFKKLLVTN